MIAAVGCIPTPAGIGTPVTRGAGRRSTTDDGVCTTATVGFGFRELFGLPHGFLSAIRTTTAAGRPCHPALITPQSPVSLITDLG